MMKAPTGDEVVPGDRPDISVVVMGYRNETTIADAVRSVLDQEADARVEVVVVTSGGDESGNVVRHRFPTVAVIESEERLMPGGARNVGLEAARGEVVAFLAADCRAEPGWVHARLAAHRAGHPVVAGAVTAALPAGAVAWGSHLALYCGRLPGRRRGPVCFPDPAAHGSSFDRDVLERVGPFDAALRIGEDTDFTRRLADADIPVWFEPSVRTAHRGPGRVGELIADHCERGRRSVRHLHDCVRTEARPRTDCGLEISARRAVVVAPAAVLFTLRTVTAEAWRNSPGGRLRLLVALPWTAVAVGAGTVGRYRQRVALGRDDATRR